MGRTVVLNVSSGDRENRDEPYAHYAIIDTSNWNYKIKPIVDYERIRIMGYTTLGLYEDVDPKSTNSEILLMARRSGIDTRRYEKRLESLKQKKPKIERRLNLPKIDECAFVDVETGLNVGSKPGRLWLVGIQYQGIFQQFLWPKHKGKFLNFLKANNITKLVHWSSFDRSALYPILSKAKIRPEYIDALKRTGNCVVWHSYNLDNLYHKLLGNASANNEERIPGRFAGIYADHLLFSKRKCRYCPSWSRIN
ncbi:MAG: hypothetical protein ACRDGA_14055, partial [Bacteroidota bacterium]